MGWEGDRTSPSPVFRLNLTACRWARRQRSRHSGRAAAAPSVWVRATRS